MFEIAAFFLIELNKKEESDFWEVKLKLAFLLFGSAIFSDFISFFLGVEASYFLDEKIFFSDSIRIISAESSLSLLQIIAFWVT